MDSILKRLQQKHGGGDGERMPTIKKTLKNKKTSLAVASNKNSSTQPLFEEAKRQQLILHERQEFQIKQGNHGGRDSKLPDREDLKLLKRLQQKHGDGDRKDGDRKRIWRDENIESTEESHDSPTERMDPLASEVGIAPTAAKIRIKKIKHESPCTESDSQDSLPNINFLLNDKGNEDTFGQFGQCTLEFSIPLVIMCLSVSTRIVLLIMPSIL